MTGQSTGEARVACPFCGGEASTEVDDEDFDVARGICKDCGACGPFVDLSDYPTTAAARDAAGIAWDTRAAPALTPDTIGSHFGNGGGFDPVARDIGAVAWMLRSNETGEVIFDEVCVWRDRESAEDAVAEIDPELMDYSADAVPFPLYAHPPHPAPVDPVAGGEAVPHRWKGVIPLIEQITVEEGASVTFVCANPDFNGLPNEAVTVFQGEDWQEVTYRADTLADCLRAALENKATP